MAEIQQEKFPFFLSYFEAAQELEDGDRLSFYDAVCRYAFYGKESDLTPALKALFVVVKPYMDKSLAFYAKQRENGNKPKRNKPKEANAEPKKAETETDTEKETETIKNSGKKRFCPPTLEEVQTYCSERKNGVDAERFFDYYSANGWVQGKSPIKDWKACIRTWERNSIGTSQTVEKKENPFAQYGGVLV